MREYARGYFISRFEPHPNVTGFSCPIVDAFCRVVPFAGSSHLAGAELRTRSSQESEGIKAPTYRIISLTTRVVFSPNATGLVAFLQAHGSKQAAAHSSHPRDRLPTSTVGPQGRSAKPARRRSPQLKAERPLAYRSPAAQLVNVANKATITRPPAVSSGRETAGFSQAREVASR